MRYKKFIIKNYRAISNEIVVDFEKNSLIPIIGVNECGKTTILQAIYAFDYFNDKLNNGMQIENTQNLYHDSDKAPLITAEVEISNENLYEILNYMKSLEEFDIYKNKIEEYLSIDFGNEVIITRNLYLKSYLLKNEKCKDRKFNNIFCKEIIQSLPYILYFDDFRDSISDEIEINDKKAGWIEIIQELFKRTNEDYSVYKLGDLEERRRKTIIGKVQKHLNTTLTKEWQNFRLDDKEALKIEIEYKEKGKEDNLKSYINLSVIEKDENDESHYFYIKDRSKGFYWFFNFVMKTEFNPKNNHVGNENTIYLLDEPGSYLHASAQTKLCKKLSALSEKNKVVYCTHSHYLLNPENISINSIRIAEKLGNGSINFCSIHDYKGSIDKGRTAFQPILDALEIKPLPFDMNSNKILLTEGIYDYYALTMFKGKNDVNIIPCIGADSIKYYISLMIAWNKSYKALWDNDKDGKNGLNKAKLYFGDIESHNNFKLLPLKGKNCKKRILQDLIDGSDYNIIKEELEIKASSFNKIMLNLFYSKNREDILKKVSDVTKNNFDEVFNLIN